jgi:putative FmdB family regulatory protein
MPMYEYRCADCGHEFEIIQKFSDEPLTQCPQCAGTVTKPVSQSGFQLKGSGWYVTDYARKDSGGKATAGGKTEAKTDDAKSASKTETKSEAATTATPAAANKKGD